VLPRFERKWLQAQSFDEASPERIRTRPFDAIGPQLARWWLPE
jgi:hypothetical protein